MDEKNRPQNIILEDRNMLNISGVEHVENFNDSQIVLETIKGALIIKGDKLNISKLNLEDGNVKIEGDIHSLVYSNKSLSGSKSGGLLGKMFK